MKRTQGPKDTGYDDKTNEQDDREFRDFMESITVTKEELAAMVGVPRSSRRKLKGLSSGMKGLPIKTMEPPTQGDAKRPLYQYWRALAAAVIAAAGAGLHGRSQRKT